MPLLLAALLSSAAARQPVTIEAVAAPAPRVPQVFWAPDGSCFAYADNEVIKIYLRSTGESRDLIALKILENAASAPAAGQPYAWRNRNAAERTIQWFPDSRRLLIAAKGDLFEVFTDGRRWRQLTATAEVETDPKLSPDGTRVAFERNHDLYTLPVASGREKRLTRDGTSSRLNARLDWVYPEELDLKTAYWWSPDGRHIAYLQFDVSNEQLYPHAALLGVEPVYEPQRYPRAGSPNARVRLGVVPAGGGRTKWMDTGTDRETYLARVQWIPGSKEVAAIRLNRPQTRLDLLACSVSSGKSQPLLSEADPFWINVADEWRFLSDGRFLWPSERANYRHLYLYSKDGSRRKQLTRGDWEVTALSGIDEKGGWVYFTAGRPSPLERQVYRVPLSGGEPVRITLEPGTHAVSMAPAANAYVDYHSSIERPPREIVVSPGAEPQRTLQRTAAQNAAQYDLQPVELVSFQDRRGIRFHGCLVKPPAFDRRRKYPLIVMIYGGPGHQAVRNSWQGIGIDQLLAAHGFVVWQMDNRGSSGRGHAWESVLHRRLGVTELEDQKAGIDWLLPGGFIDPARIGIFGSSYGGFLTIYSLLHAPDIFRAGVAGAPVTDWRNYDSIYTERYLETPAANPDGYRLSALLPDAPKLRGKLLMVHNFEDDNVLFQNTVQMLDTFERAGKQVNLRLYPQKTHAITGSYRRDMIQAVVEFFEQQLKQDKPETQ